MDTKKEWIIAGPCALESREILRLCIQELKQLGVNAIRAGLWKPRTLPGWEGMGEEGLPILLEETLNEELIPATEIMNQEQAKLVAEALRTIDPSAEMILWIGARNQNHLEQRAIAEALAEGPEGIYLMFKNAPWEDERHWLGIYQHLLSGGFPEERLLICHRGFHPGRAENPLGRRNLPNYEMAMRIREKTGAPLILDPSHIGGEATKVIEVMKEAEVYSFDGLLVEVHLEPERARTDASQQLTLEKFREALASWRSIVA